MAEDSMGKTLKFGKMPEGKTALFMCDLQEKFRPAMFHFTDVVSNAKKLVESTKILEIPLVVTEQYPQGLGSTVNEINIQHAVGTIAKTKFSMFVPEVENILKTTCNGQLKCAILFGVEAHVCVEQTAIDLISNGISVHIVADATTSRTQEDRLLAFERLKQIGCFIATSENVIYKLIGDKNHPKFNEIRPLIKDTTVETGLVSKMGESASAQLSWRFQLELAHSVLTELSTTDRFRASQKAIFELMKEFTVLLKNDENTKKQFSKGNVELCFSLEKDTKLDNQPLAPKLSNKEKNCSTCGKLFSRPQDLKRHLRTHNKTSAYLCEECGKSYRSLDGLSYHKALNHRETNDSSAESLLKCSKCNKSFTNQIQLNVHLKNSHHRAKSVYTCEICIPTATFERKDVFKNHVALHERVKPFACRICDKNFSSRSNLQSHARTHDASVALQCPNCSKKFSSKKKLDSHIPECIARKSCPSCKFVCQSEEEMTEHTKKEHPADYAIHEVFGHALEELS